MRGMRISRVFAVYSALCALYGAVAAPLAAQDRFVAPLPPDADVVVTRDVEYARTGDATLKFDLYRARTARDPVPVVILLNGIGADWMRGHVQYMGWGRYLTTRGMAGVTMDSAEGAVPENFDRLLAYLEAHAGALGIDPSRLVVWACSANVTAALPLVQDVHRGRVSGAVMYYGTGEVSAYRLDLPLMVVRAGLDNPALNRDIDAIVSAAAAANVPLTAMNVQAGHHGFDVRDDNDESRAVLSATLDFMAAAADPARIQARARGLTLARAGAASFRGDWRAASEAYRVLADERPRDPEVQQRLGEALLAQNDLRPAVAALQRSLALNTSNKGIVTFALVRAHAKLGDVDRAFEWLEKLQPYVRFFRTQLKEETDFAALRKDPRWTKLVSP
jgi:dienelactone hydrolase